MPLGAPVEPDEYSQKHASSPLVGAGCRESRAPASSFAGDDDLADRRPRRLAERLLERREQRGGDDERARTAVVEDVAVVAGREQRIHGDGHDPSLDRSQEYGRKVDRIVQRQHDALLRYEPEREQRIARAVHPRCELGKRKMRSVVDVGELSAAPVAQVSLDEIVRRVVEKRDLDPRRAYAVIGRAESGHGFLLCRGPTF